MSGQHNDHFFNPHLKIAHELWAKHLQPGNCAVDATCGNGHDLIYLAELTISAEPAKIPNPLPKLFAYDVQSTALLRAQSRARRALTESQFERVCWLERCHSQIGEAEKTAPLALVVYNLGYLPGGNKELVSRAETTVASLQLAMQKLTCRGAISITCYPRHVQGHREWLAVRSWAGALNPKDWNICQYSWLNRPLSPVLFWAQKKN